MKIVFWGTPEFSLPALRALGEEGHEVVGVVTQPDRPAGRGRGISMSPVKTVALEEGCLSIPGVGASVERPVTCVVEATDAQGNPVRIEAEGMLARCLQHEIDHLDGVLFIDRLSPIKRKMLLAKYRKLADK